MRGQATSRTSTDARSSPRLEVPCSSGTRSQSVVRACLAHERARDSTIGAISNSERVFYALFIPKRVEPLRRGLEREPEVVILGRVPKVARGSGLDSTFEATMRFPAGPRVLIRWYVIWESSKGTDHPRAEDLHRTVAPRGPRAAGLRLFQGV